MSVRVQMGELEKSLPDLIIQILAKNFPKRIGEIQQDLLAKFQVKLSFQAVRKALNILVTRGKLVMRKKEYQLSKAWIKDNKKISDKIVENYFIGESKAKPPKVSKIGSAMQVFNFENSLQADKFLGELLLEIAAGPGKKILCIQAYHYWYFLGHLGTESDFLQAMLNQNVKLNYLSFGGSSFLDRLAKSFYQQHGIKFKVVKKNLEKNSEISVINDVIIRVEYSDKFIEKLQKLYYSTKSLRNFDFLSFGKLIQSKYPITLTLFKDSTMAENIRQNTLRFFN